MGRDAGIRLGLALVLSVALHLSLIFGIAVGPAVPAQTIVARLVPPAPTARPVADKGAESRSSAPKIVRASSDEMLKRDAAGSPRAGEPKIRSTPAARADETLLPRADVPLLVDPVWYLAKDLDVYPRPVTPVEPVYPESAVDVSGEVSLLLKVDEFGAVQEIAVVKAEPAGYFEDSASRSFKAARFSPAQRDGHPVRSQIVIKMRFAPQIQASAVR